MISNKQDRVITTIQQLRKVELHRHIEGCISPKLLETLVLKYEPDSKLLQEGEIKKLFTYNEFRDFLIAFGTAVQYLRNYDDFTLLAKEVVQQLKEENIVYAELIFSAQSYLKIGLDFEKIMETMHEEFAKSGIKTHIILDIVRHWGVGQAESYVDTVLDVYNGNSTLRDWIVAISIGGDEITGPAELFNEVFENARNAGLFTYAHAGEWDTSQSVWNAINLLEVSRIGHGIAAIDDQQLLDFLREHDLMLDISITSNYLTQSLKVDEKHPVSKFIAKKYKNKYQYR